MMTTIGLYNDDYDNDRYYYMILRGWGLPDMMMMMTMTTRGLYDDYDEDDKTII